MYQFIGNARDLPKHQPRDAKKGGHFSVVLEYFLAERREDEYGEGKEVHWPWQEFHGTDSTIDGAVGKARALAEQSAVALGLEPEFYSGWRVAYIVCGKRYEIRSNRFKWQETLPPPE